MKTCFVIMPFGEKLDIGNQQVDFDVIYKRLIKPPLEVLGLKVMRCDEIPNPGSVHRDMLKHIFEDDVAVVDITTLNANVFYELGVRHALRRGVTVLLRKKGTTSPFNIQGMRTIEYDIDLEGAELARDALRRSVEHALAHPANDSLVYEVFPNLTVAVPVGQT
jgi:hypothetical protein